MTQTQRQKILLESGTNRLGQCRVATNPQFVKKYIVSVKCNKAKYNKRMYDCTQTHVHKYMWVWKQVCIICLVFTIFYTQCAKWNIKNIRHAIIKQKNVMHNQEEKQPIEINS